MDMGHMVAMRWRWQKLAGSFNPAGEAAGAGPIERTSPGHISARQATSRCDQPLKEIAQTGRLRV